MRMPLIEKIFIAGGLIVILFLSFTLVVETIRVFSKPSIETYGDTALLKEIKKRDILRFVVIEEEK